MADLTVIEDTRIATISQQIAEIENDNELLENEIEDEERAIVGLERDAAAEIACIARELKEKVAKHRSAIRSKRRRQTQNNGRADKMRAKRQIFAVTAAQLRLVDMS